MNSPARSAQPLVSVGIPVYNVEPYIARSLTSVLDQDYANIEIILIYDQSADNSLQVAKEILSDSGRPYEIVEKDIETKGLGNSRNIILDRFRGEFLYFVDSDDYIEPFSIRELVYEAAKAGVDIVAASHRSFDEADNFIGTYAHESRRYFTGDEFREYVYVRNGFHSLYSWNKLYRRSFIKDNDLSYVNIVMEDALFSYLELKYLRTILVLPMLSLNYLQRESSITQAAIAQNMSSDTAEFLLSIRNMKYEDNYTLDLSSICCCVDAFVFTYILMVRDAYSSDKISQQNKVELCCQAFRTPKVPLFRFFSAFKSKGSKLFLLLFVSVLSDGQNLKLVKAYHFYKRLRGRLKGLIGRSL